MCVWISAAEELDQLTALAFRHAADRLRGRDPAAAEEASGPRRTDLWHCEQEISNLGRGRAGGRLRENILDPHSPGGEFLLQGRSPAADLVRLPQGPQPLIERLRRSSLAPLARHRAILGNPRLAERLTAACPSTSCLSRRRWRVSRVGSSGARSLGRSPRRPRPPRSSGRSRARGRSRPSRAAGRCARR